MPGLILAASPSSPSLTCLVIVNVICCWPWPSCPDPVTSVLSFTGPTARIKASKGPLLYALPPACHEHWGLNSQSDSMVSTGHGQSDLPDWHTSQPASSTSSELSCGPDLLVCATQSASPIWACIRHRRQTWLLL